MASILCRLGVAGSSLLIGTAVFAVQPGAKADAQTKPVSRAEPPLSENGIVAAPEVDQFIVRSGYRCVAVANVAGARFLALGPAGELYVSRPRQADVLKLVDTNADGVFDKRTTFVSGKSMVHGLSWHGDELWIATSGEISRVKDEDGDGVAEKVVVVIPDGQLPRGGGHWWRSLLVTDAAIFTSIGDSGNITDEAKRAPDRQKIWRFNHDGGEKTLFASGIRNTEKLLLRPGTQEVWGFDHGSDWFGKQVGDVEDTQPITDINPPDELNHYVEGGFYGHPFIVGNRLPRFEYLDRPDIHELAAKTTPPEWAIGAHWATNGFTFLDPLRCGPSKHMPADHAGDVLVACHGSWNSSRRVGYCIARVLFDAGKPYGLLKLVQTLSSDQETVLARPVDAVQADDGSVLWSSDQPGRIYRLTHVRAGTGPDAAPVSELKP